MKGRRQLVGGPAATTPQQLRELWGVRFPRRANGGWWALSGFTIQMTVALESFFRAVFIEKKDPRALRVEDLSDTLLEGANVTTLSQVKRTLTPTTLGSALHEAYDIISLCSAELAQNLRFQIVCERCEDSLSIEGASVSNIFAAGEPYDSEILDRTRKLFDPNKPIRVMAHPALALQRILWNIGVDDPRKVMRECLGLLFAAFDGKNRAAVEEAIYAAISLVRQAIARTASRNVGRLLIPNDFAVLPAVPMPSRRVMVGRRPRLLDLTQSRFRDRPRLLSAAEVAAFAWLANLPRLFEEDDGALPVFWLSGRAGDGKSVLLLQLIARLVTSGALAYASELQTVQEFGDWLKSRPNWSAEVADETPFEIGFIDDLHAELDSGEANSLIDRCFYRGTPYAALITCGATDEVAPFSSRASRLTITSFEVPHTDAAELEEFRVWDEEHTGISRPPIAPAGDTPLVAWLWQLGGGLPEPALASNVRMALGQAHIFMPARVAVAVNALMLGAPIELLTTDAERASFSTFAVRGDDGLELRTEAGQTGLFLGHAEVIWPMYAAWAREDDVDVAWQWGQDIAEAIAVHLRERRPQPARVMLGRLLDQRFIAGRLQKVLQDASAKEAKKHLLGSAFEALAERCDAAHQAPLMRLWLAAQRWLMVVSAAELRGRAAALIARPDIEPGDKADVAVGLLSTGARGGDPSGTAAASYVLRAAPSPTVVAFLANQASRGAGCDHAQLVRRWLDRHGMKRAAALVFAAALGRSKDATLLDQAYRFVREFKGDADSGPVLWALARAGKHPEYRHTIDLWLAAAPEPATAMRLYDRLLGSSAKALYATRALVWAEQNPHVRGVHEVIIGLIACLRAEPRLHRLIKRWMAANVGSSQACQVLGALVSQPEHRDRWVHDAMVVARAAGSDRQGPMLGRLMKACPTLEVMQLALQHIDADPSDAASRFLFSALAETLRRLPADRIRALGHSVPCGQQALLAKVLRWEPPNRC